LGFEKTGLKVDGEVTVRGGHGHDSVQVYVPAMQSLAALLIASAILNASTGLTNTSHSPPSGEKKQIPTSDPQTRIIAETVM
jgi:hypothetical protein